MRGDRTRWVMSGSGFPATCFPAGLDTSELIEVTTVSDSWGKFLDPQTGQVHDCAEYYEAMTRDCDGG